MNQDTSRTLGKQHPELSGTVPTHGRVEARKALEGLGFGSEDWSALAQPGFLDRVWASIELNLSPSGRMLPLPRQASDPNPFPPLN